MSRRKRHLQIKRKIKEYNLRIQQAMENVDAVEGRGAALAPLYRHEGRRILTNK